MQPETTNYTDPAGMGLAEAMAQRICHDFAGLLGTLGCTLDMAAEDREAASLAQETASVLAARLRLLRDAWGGGAETLDRATIAELAPGLPGIERLRLECAALAVPLEDAAARLCLCLLLVAATALPRGGTIALSGGGHGIIVTIDGKQAAWPALLTQAPPAASPVAAGDLPALMCHLVADAARWRLRVDGMRAVAEPRR